MTSHSISKRITVFLNKKERRELIKSEQKQYVTAFNGLNPWLDDQTTDLLLFTYIEV